MIFAFVVGILAVLLAFILGCLLKRYCTDVDAGLLPETPPDVIAWRERQARRAEQASAPMTAVHAPRPTSWQENTASFATTPAQAIDQERHVGVRRALGYLEQGMRGRAHYELTRSVVRQARIAGLGTVDLKPTCAPPAAEPCATDEAPRKHLALVAPVEPEVLCGQTSPHLTGFSCANPPHDDDQHWYAARRNTKGIR